ncbi:growth hormone secretagogue receptor type 1-like [Physella acuta]|uniref:growth hormone secretagogue receptor type 1-like n=1 Tax=Physella acuta TaxID=109671 RepID=UPI0027DE2800|nr:growth hormone secretagogue receptor type 1-like [Physella acuta]
MNDTNYVKIVSPLFPTKALEAFMLFNLFCIEITAILGIIGNGVSIVVFARQGFKDSINVTLAVLAASDIGALVTNQMFGLLNNPWFQKSNLPIDYSGVATMLVYIPHNYFSRVCGFVTAFASFERCLCVLAPLQVKQIITRNVAIVVNVTICVLMLLDFVPSYYIYYLDWVFIPATNQTKLLKLSRVDPINVFSKSLYVTEFTLPYLTFFFIIITTVVIGIQLKGRLLWRKTVTLINKDAGFKSLNKEMHAVQMLAVVSVVFVVCLTPQTLVITIAALFPEVSHSEIYYNIFLFCYSLSYLLETVSSSVNPLVYYNMSGRYRKTFFVVLDVFFHLP